VLDDITSLNRTSNRLLLLAQASAENAEAGFAAVRIDEMLWQAETELRRRKPDYTVSIDFEGELDDDAALTINGNDQLIKTAFLNLMENACKFSSDHKVEVLLKVLANNIELVFKDRGMGIDPKDINHIFEPFYRSPDAITIKGHGIGLSLVDRVVTLHKGTIRVSSKPNHGSVFTLVFPTVK